MESEVILQKGRMWLDEDGTVHIVWSPRAELTLADAEASMVGYDRLRQGRSLALLVDTRTIRSMNREVRTLYSGAHTAEITTAVALLIESPLSAAMGNFYLQVNKPVVPTRLFASEAAAFQWLGTLTDNSRYQPARSGADEHDRNPDF